MPLGYAGLIVVVLVGSALKVPAYPFNDPALFEYYGRAIVNGAHLYRDIYDVKPPSIYFVDALLQIVFGANYVAHTWAESALNAGSVALFILLARALRAPAPWSGALLFAVCFCLTAPQFNQVQDYAVFFILLAYLLAVRGRQTGAGAALAVATTFWLPAVLLLGPLVWRDLGARARILVLGSYAGALLVYYAAFAVVLGPRWPLEMVAFWGANLGGHGLHIAGLASTFTRSSIGIAVGSLLLLVALVVRRVQNQGQRFALIWSGFALLAASIPPRFFDLYFLPAIPALAMTVAAYGLSPLDLRRRPIVAVLAVASALFAARADLIGTQTAFNYASYARGVGLWIAGSAGPGRVLWTSDYVPEVYLAANAIPPSPQSMVIADVRAVPGGYASLGWTRRPQLAILGGTREQPAPQLASLMLDAIDYTRVCPHLALGEFDVLALPEIGMHFYCRN